MSVSDPQNVPLWRKVLSALTNTAFTLVVIAGAGVAVVFGATELTKRAEANETNTVAPMVPVQVRALTLDDGYAVTRRFVGQVEAAQSVQMSFELSGRLEGIYVDEGASVEAGQVVARLDTSLLLAEDQRLTATREALQAQLIYAEQSLERAEALNDRGFAPTDRLDQASAQRTELIARLAEVDALKAAVTLRLEKSELRAPLSGRITTRAVDGGETLSPGQVILGLVEDARARVRVGLPTEMPVPKTGVQVTVGGQVFAAEFDSQRPDVDPVTRTRPVLFVVDTDSQLLLGQTATIELTQRIEMPGTWIETRALKEAERGTWSVLVVDDENVVRRALVEAIHADGTRVFVRGTFPEGTRMITTGPHRVTPGQTVQIAQEG